MPVTRLHRSLDRRVEHEMPVSREEAGISYRKKPAHRSSGAGRPAPRSSPVPPPSFVPFANIARTARNGAGVGSRPLSALTESGQGVGSIVVTGSALSDIQARSPEASAEGIWQSCRPPCHVACKDSARTHDRKTAQTRLTPGQKARICAAFGPMAEWLRRGLQILAPEFDSRSGLHSIQISTQDHP